MVRKARLGWNRLEPLYVLKKLLSALRYIIETSLRPFHPITLIKVRRHVFDSFTSDEFLQGIHSIDFELSDIVPPVEVLPVVVGLLICTYDVPFIVTDVMEFRWWDIMSILAVISWIIRVGGIRFWNRLLHLF